MTFPNIPPVPVNAQTITAAGGALLTNIDAIATQAAAASTQYYATTAAGLAATTNGQYFVLPGDGLTTYANLYRNNAGSAVLVAEASAAAIINSQGYNVLSAGAVGDGVTDDTLAIRSAITSAGVNGVLIFPPGKTFLLTGSLNPMQGQTWIGSGAILKRAAEVKTTTASAIVKNVNGQTITLSSVTGFSVGMDVTVFDGATSSTADNYNHRITALDAGAKTITVDTPFAKDFPSGGTVIRSFSQIDTTRTGTNVPDVTIKGLRFDGNQAGNASLQWWWVNNEILAGGDRLKVLDCYIVNAQAEAIQCGGIGIEISRNWIKDCQGNGIHLSAATGGSNQARITGNYIKNCNLSGTLTGHADGCIVLSNLVADTLVDGNYCENGIGGVSSINSNDNSDITIANNTIRNCTQYAIGGLTSNDYVQNLIIEGNRCYSSGYIYLYSGGSPSAGVGPRRFIVTGNLLVLTWIRALKCYDGVISGNNIYNVGDTTNNAVEVTSCQGVVVQGNNIVGGNRNIVVAGTTNSKEILVTGNRCRDAYNQGIALFDDAMISCAAIGNSVGVNATFTPATSYVGIMVGNGSTANSNVVNVETNTTGQYGIRCPNGATNTLGAIVCNNQIRSSTNVPSIKLFGGSQNNIVVNNFILQAIAQGGAGAQPNTVTGNITIY